MHCSGKSSPAIVSCTDTQTGTRHFCPVPTIVFRASYPLAPGIALSWAALFVRIQLRNVSAAPVRREYIVTERECARSVAWATPLVAPE